MVSEVSDSYFVTTRQLFSNSRKDLPGVLHPTPRHFSKRAHHP